MTEDRADTDGKKEAVTSHLLANWKIPPDLRLGQLVYSSVANWLTGKGQRAAERDIALALFYLEDAEIAAAVSVFVREKYPAKA